ncbi:MAG: MerR family transcriptional regulator [Kangiellaceae bacterium]|jgi:MerR family transcriptional regulator, mercuric resistance operon regulatory protein
MKTIGKLAKELAINSETIRYYEREGLIQQPKKPTRGYRLYSDSIAARIRFIGKAKALGFSLKEIKALISMDGNCQQVELMGLKKLAVIRRKIADLKQLEKVISEMTRKCHQNQNPSDCPIINSLK